MSAPVITAVATYVPPAVSPGRWRAIEAALSAGAPCGWNTWIASWRPDFAPYLEEAAVPRTVDALTMAMKESLRDRIPVERDTDLSGLAARVTQTIRDARHPDAAPIDIVMFCHSSLDEHVSTTTAGRLRTVVGPPCFPFSVSQQQGASLFTALQLARDLLIAEPEIHTILIVAAEKWRPPFARRVSRGILHGDAAGALLVERSAMSTHGLRLIDVCTRRLHQLAAQLTPTHAEIDAKWLPALLSMIDELLARHNLHPSDIAAIVGQDIDPRLDDLVCRHLGFRASEHHRRAYLGAAESIVRLADTLDADSLRSQDRILMWGIGLGGYLGCASLASQGVPRLYRYVGARTGP